MTMKTKIPFTAEFPALGRKIDGRRMVYLDSACTALKMKSAAEAHNGLLLKLGGCGGKRSSHALSLAVEELFGAARDVAAAFTGAASSEEIIFTSGATEAANIFAGAFPFTPVKNEVILSPLEHNSVFLPFYNLSKAGRIKLKVMPLKGYKPDIKAFEKMLGKRTALVCAARASNFFGGSVDLKNIAAPAKQAGAAVFSDDAQFAATHPIEAMSSGADALVFSGHKLGAPFGTGVLWVKRSLLEKLRPFKVGGGVVKSVERSGSGFKVEYLKGFQGFEAGIQNYAGAVAMAETFRTLSSLGRENIRAHMAEIAAYTCERLSGIKKIKVLGDKTDLQNGSIVPFIPAGRAFSPADLNIFLNTRYKDKFFAVRTGRHCADLASLTSGLAETVRLSFFVYTTKQDIDAFAKTLEHYLSLL